jgi:hypothetical protein
MIANLLAMVPGDSEKHELPETITETKIFNGTPEAEAHAGGSLTQTAGDWFGSFRGDIAVVRDRPEGIENRTAIMFDVDTAQCKCSSDHREAALLFNIDYRYLL